MRKLLLALALLFPTSAWAQCSGVFPANTVCGNLTGSAKTPSAVPFSGNIVGPGSSTNNGLVLWGNTVGSQLKDGAGQTIAGNYTWSGTNTHNGLVNFTSIFQIGGNTITWPGVAGSVAFLNVANTWPAAQSFNAGLFATTGATLNLTGLSSGTLNQRGPLFIWNDPSSTAAGQNTGLQIWTGNAPTATPGAGDFVGFTNAMINGQGRSAMWAENLLVLNTPSCGDGTCSDGPLVGSEIDMLTGYAGAPSAPFGGGNTKTGLQIFGSAGGASDLTVGIALWSPNTSSGSGWWKTGIALSRNTTYGIRCMIAPGDVSTAFATACFEDESNSANVLAVSGTHTNGVVLSSGTFSGAAFNSPGFSVSGVGALAAASFTVAGGASGVNCAGAPTGSFAVSVGIVTHC